MYYFDEWVLYDRFPMMETYPRKAKPKPKKRKVTVQTKKTIAPKVGSIV